MSRWKVAQHVHRRYWIAYPAAYDAEQPESNVDDDLPRKPLARGFRKWQDAMDYADRTARTYEVVLPRVDYGDHVVADKGVYSLHVEYSKYMTSIYLGGWEGAHIPNSQLWDLAVYLAACATHWEAHQ